MSYDFLNSEWKRHNRMKRKYQASPDVHIHGKPEGKVLRALMSQTGLTEKELREIPMYRVMLSDTQDVTHNKHTFDWYKILEKRKTLLDDLSKNMKLNKKHPQVVKIYKKKLELLNSKKYEPLWLLCNWDKVMIKNC